MITDINAITTATVVNVIINPLYNKIGKDESEVKLQRVDPFARGVSGDLSTPVFSIKEQK